MKKIVLISFSLLFITHLTYSQTVSSDSIESLNKKVAKSESEKQLNVQKLKLASLQNKLPEKQKIMQKHQHDAQQAADYNAKIANQLKNEPDNRKLARKARKSARSSEKLARSTKSATDDYNDLQRDIEDLLKNIKESENKLNEQN